MTYIGLFGALGLLHWIACEIPFFQVERVNVSQNRRYLSLVTLYKEVAGFIGFRVRILTSHLKPDLNPDENPEVPNFRWVTIALNIEVDILSPWTFKSPQTTL